MRSILTATAFLVVAALMAGCSMFIPDQEVPDPLGLDGQAISIQVDDGPAVFAAALQPQATGTAIVTGSIGDFEDPLPIQPKTYTVSQPLASTAQVTTSGDYPETIVLSGLELSVTISDSDNELVVSLQPSGSATLTHTGGGSYSVSTTSFSVSITGSQMTGLNTLLTGGGTNTVTGELQVTSTSTPDLPGGSVILLYFGTAEGTIGF